jgi:glycosyltransferase involved in cell wall biosynthesis
MYQPEPNFITAEVAEALAQESDVTVITAHPNYPLGRFYHGTRYLRIERSNVNRVTVWRVPFLPDHSLSPVRRAVSYLSFALVASVVAPFLGGRPDTVWVYHGPFTTGIAAVFFKLAYRSRIVFTCADLWPESFAASGLVKSRLVMRVMAAYNRALNNVADVIVCATRGTMHRFQKDGIGAERMHVIPVWIGGVSELASVASPEYAGTRNIVYAGNLGPAQNLDTVILAAAALEKEGAGVHFDIYGTGASETELKRLAAQSAARNVSFHGRVPLDQAFRCSSTSLAQIICLKPSALFRMTVPSKLYSAFAAGSPLLYGLEGEAAAIAEQSAGGIMFDPRDPKTLVNAIHRLLNMPPEQRVLMRQNLTSFYWNNFDPSRLLSRYRTLLGEKGIPANRGSECEAKTIQS